MKAPRVEPPEKRRAPALPPVKQPKSAAEAADLAERIRRRRRVLEKDVDDLKRLEADVRKVGLAFLLKDRAESVKGKLGVLTIKRDPVPIVDDWDALYEHIRKTGEFELLERRVGVGAARERLDEAVEIPGVRFEPKIEAKLYKR